MKVLTIASIIVIVYILIPCCAPATHRNMQANTKDVVINNTNTKNDTIRIANDSLEYEVIIIDPGFNNWMYSRAKPRGYYGENYMKSRNTQWVIEWNMRVNQPQRFGDMYQMRIDYDPSIKYGYEVNYLLFNYLSYFQIANNQRLGALVPRD